MSVNFLCPVSLSQSNAKLKLVRSLAVCEESLGPFSTDGPPESQVESHSQYGTKYQNPGGFIRAVFIRNHALFGMFVFTKTQRPSCFKKSSQLYFCSTLYETECFKATSQ